MNLIHWISRYFHEILLNIYDKVRCQLRDLDFNVSIAKLYKLPSIYVVSRDSNDIGFLLLFFNFQMCNPDRDSADEFWAWKVEKVLNRNSIHNNVKLFGSL